MDNGADSGMGGSVSSNLVRFPAPGGQRVAFDRKELMAILDLYGRFVAGGDWRDYAMDFGKETAEFQVFRRSSEQPLYRIVKTPAAARRNALYAVIAQGGLILKRGNDLVQVMRVLLRKPKLAGGS